MGAQMQTPGGRPGVWTYTCTESPKGSADSLKYQALPRCIVCRTPVSQSFHTLCRSCFAWHLAGQHLGRYRSLTRLVVGVRT